MADILARAMASDAKEQVVIVQQTVESLPNGIVYRGAVDTYAELPSNPEEGDAYTVIELDDDEFVWGNYKGVMKWINLSPELATVAKTGSYTDLTNKLTAGTGITLTNNVIGYDEEVVSSVEYVDANITDTMNFIIQERDTEKAARQAGDEALQTAISGKQNAITSDNKLSYNLLKDTPSIPEVDVDKDYVDGEIERVENEIPSVEGLASEDYVDSAVAGKQDTLTAGENITIVDNVISATGGGGSSISADGATILNNSGVISTAIGGSRTQTAPEQELLSENGLSVVKESSTFDQFDVTTYRFNVGKYTLT